MQAISYVTDALRVVTILLTGIMAGFFFAYSYNVNIAFEGLNASTYAEAMQRINVAVRNPVFFAVFFPAVLVPALAVILSWRRYQSLPFWLFLAGFVVYFVGSFLVTAQINLPLNAYLESWSIQSPPPDWDETRRSWNQANLVRTWASIIAFACYLLALVVPERMQ